MKTIAIKGDPRNDLGKAATRKLRAKGIIPAVVYGPSGSSNFAVYEADFKNLVYTPNTYLVQLDLEEGQRLAKLQDITFHPVSEAITHADFLEVTQDAPVKLKIPVKITGNSPGVRSGGKLMVKIRKLNIMGLIKDIPDFIEINIDQLELGKNIRVKDLTANAIQFLDEPENSICSCVQTRASISAAAEEAKGKK